MKFYTAEMVNRWNGDFTGANQEQYDREWVEAQDGYDLHYARLADNFPASVRKFTELVLHNEAVIALPKALDFDRIVGAYEGNVVGYKSGDEYTVVTACAADKLLHVTTYTLELPPVVKIHDGNGFDPPENVAVWLYDEFSMTDTGLFQHNVLFSNGVELIVTFKTMHWYECLMQAEG